MRLMTVKMNLCLLKTCSFKGKEICNGTKESKNHECCSHAHGMSENTRHLCEIIAEAMKQKCKKIRFNVEIINDSD